MYSPRLISLLPPGRRGLAARGRARLGFHSPVYLLAAREANAGRRIPRGFARVWLIGSWRRGWEPRRSEIRGASSIIQPLSGLFDDVNRCCQRTGSREHTYLHSLGFFGKTQDLPSEDELEIITMCGHGMIAARRVRWLVEGIRAGETTPAEAAENVARPCLCGIVNRERAGECFQRLVPDHLGADRNAARQRKR
jgi:hypothetical protein